MCAKSQGIHLTQGKAIFVDQPDFLWAIPGLLRYDLFLCLHLVDRKDKEKNYWTAGMRKLLLSSHTIGPLIVTLGLSETASISSLIPAHAESLWRKSLSGWWSCSGWKWTQRSHSPLSNTCSFRVVCENVYVHVCVWETSNQADVNTTSLRGVWRGNKGNPGKQSARDYLGSVNTKGTKVMKEHNNNKTKITHTH